MTNNAQRGSIVLVGSKKGGVGKSTVATNLAVSFSRQGADVVLIDADPQKNAANWAARRQTNIDEGAELPVVHCIEKTTNLKAAALDAAKRYDVVVIDAAGRDSRPLREGLLVCDLAYIPSQASMFDLETLDDMAEILEETSIINEGRIIRTLVTMAPTNPSSQDAKDAKEFIGDYAEQMPLSRYTTRLRKAYKTAGLEGLGVQEMKDRKAKAEIDLISQEATKLLTEPEIA